MILGIGTDIVDIRRIGRLIHQYGERFINKIFTKKEVNYCFLKKNEVSCFAKRFAAKEAVLKAIGLGLSKDIGWLDVETSNDSFGKPEICLSDSVINNMDSLQNTKMFLSLSDEFPYAIAYVIIERERFKR